MGLQISQYLSYEEEIESWYLSLISSHFSGFSLSSTEGNLRKLRPPEKVTSKLKFLGLSFQGVMFLTTSKLQPWSHYESEILSCSYVIDKEDFLLLRSFFPALSAFSLFLYQSGSAHGKGKSTLFTTYVVMKDMKHEFYFPFSYISWSIRCQLQISCV